LGEGEWVTLLARHGKFIACGSFNMNLTFHSGVKVDPSLFRQKQRRQREKAKYLNLENKVYISMNMMESGDSTWFWQRNMKVDWFGDEARGTIPLGYNFTPLCLDVIPGIMLWYYENLTENEELFSGSSGLTYTYSFYYGQAFNDQDREEVFNEYLDLTAKYLKRMDAGFIEIYAHPGWDMDVDPQALKDHYAKYTRRIKGLKGICLIYANALYGVEQRMDASEANYFINDVPVFHCQTKWTAVFDTPGMSKSAIEEMEVNNLISEIESVIQTTDKRPIFINGMAISWTTPPTLIKKVMEHFDDDVVFVTPSELAKLYTMHKKSND